jgi:hypothetical protein
VTLGDTQCYVNGTLEGLGLGLLLLGDPERYTGGYVDGTLEGLGLGLLLFGDPGRYTGLCGWNPVRVLNGENAD